MTQAFLLTTSAFLAIAVMATGARSAQRVDLADLIADQWDIIVAKDASPSEKHAAVEFRNLFGRASGQYLHILDVPPRSDAIGQVFIGPSDALSASNVAVSTRDMGEEDFRIIVRDGNIAIAGGRPRGTLYGVYTFLEDYVGIRFLSSDHTHVPRLAKSRPVGPLDRFHHPPFEYRRSYWAETIEDTRLATRLRINSCSPQHPQKYCDHLGGITGRKLINHSFQRQIPTRIYGKDHPEYYALIDGKRRAKVPLDEDGIGTGTQPCLTNPDVLRIITEAVLHEIKASPELANVSVSQNDNHSYCRCAKCAAIDKREGTGMGSMLTFVNAVAGRVAKHHPNVKVGTLAYMYTQKPPKTIVPRPNVLIQLSSIRCSMIHPMTTPNMKLNGAFYQSLQDWQKICGDIAIWSYNCNFHQYLLPRPGLRVLQPNIRLFAENNTRCVFMEGISNSTGTPFAELRNYVTCRLLWDPKLNARRLIDEFLDLHYGKAAPPIRRFLNLIHDTAEAKAGKEATFVYEAKDYGFDESTARAGIAAFDEALRLADSPAVRARVERASICAYRLAMEDAWLWMWANRQRLDSAKMPAPLAARTRKYTKRLFELCNRFGTQRWRENLFVPDIESMFRKAYGLGPQESF